MKGYDTRPELTVRRLAHVMGYRYRLHRKDLPGKPDLVFSGLHKVIFVHGCFWHGHHCARGARVPVHNRDYWTKKIARNKERDNTAPASLKALGWDTLVVWECETHDEMRLRGRLRRFLGKRPMKTVSRNRRKTCVVT